ncbi:MAG: protein kinase [Myxococcales bacterium]|nr:protein kinase [Myxococcales bacterium]
MSRQSVSLNPGRRSAPGGLLHRLASGVARDLETERFVTLVRNTVIVAFVLVVASEVAALVSPAFPRDVAATAVMAGTFVVVGAACVLGAPRSVVAALSVLMFGVLGWYVARAIGQSGGLGSPHRDAIYPVLAGASALLLFSAVEFTAVTLLFVGTAAATTQLRGDAELSELGLTGFYILSFYCLAMVGIVARARLKRSERQARDQLERLNHNLRAEVDAQVERIRRAETLSRYLPPELSEQVLAGEAGDELAHGHRQVAVLCASPVGFLETLTTLETDEVATLVNSFVSTMSRTAFEHGGVIERFVGPRLTVLFGSLAEQAPAESVRRAVAMARDMQRACNVLLRQWEHEGLPIRLRMAIGIAAGPSVVGTFGSERRFEYSALGEAMVRAHRLTATAIPGEVRLDGSAAAWVDDQEIGPGEQVEFVPGRPEPTFVVDPHRVERAAGEPEASDEAAALQAALLATNIAPGGPGGPVGPGGAAAPAAAAAVGLDATLSPGELPAPRGAAPLLEPGQLFDGRYRIDARIGQGATATVYRAHHVALDQPRALKLLHPGQLAAPGAVEQLRREVEATARIHHPNVVQLHDFGRSLEGHYYLTLDHVDGESLAAVLDREGRLPLERALGLARGMLLALQAAHELRLVHRDLKPGNVLVDGRGQARVTDFGMAQPLHVARLHQELIAGTPAYMSPEQCEGRPLDGRTDLYSFGVTLYHLLSGALPYRDLSGDPFRLALSADRVPLAERVPTIPRAIAELVAGCLAREPADRPPSALAVLRALERAVADLPGHHDQATPR